jgi:hypothetical protein
MSIMNSYNSMADKTAELRQRLQLAEEKLLQHDIEWDGERYAFTLRCTHENIYLHPKRPAYGYRRPS